MHDWRIGKVRQNLVASENARYPARDSLLARDLVFAYLFRRTYLVSLVTGAFPGTSPLSSDTPFEARYLTLPSSGRLPLTARCSIIPAPPSVPDTSSLTYP